ncbi:hypothetical protein JQM69_07895 [Faecalicatena contorta]|uniref:hypothetical protein n=1 Tax=Faecalicatena contorta TaxID=39482 RepID=UPI001F1FA7A9|nr:hypothetical protein [Faecalicatena contorta]MCF2680615.1 hypothetical protein [Faecalicatena contorta]
MNIKNSGGPVLDQKVADQMLSNIFEACHVQPNSIPLEVLTSYSNYRKERFAFQKFTLMLIIILFCMLPFLFIYPNFTLQLKPTDTPWLPTYSIDIDAAMPIKSVVANMNGEALPVTEADSHLYTVSPDANGTLTVTVTLINNQINTQTVEVKNLDTKAPTFLSNSQEDKLVYLYLDDDRSGVDYRKIVAVDASGKRIEPYSYNETEGYVIFSYPDSTLDVYVPDKAGNTLHLVLNVK